MDFHGGAVYKRLHLWIHRLVNREPPQAVYVQGDRIPTSEGGDDDNKADVARYQWDDVVDGRDGLCSG